MDGWLVVRWYGWMDGWIDGGWMMRWMMMIVKMDGGWMEEDEDGEGECDGENDGDGEMIMRWMIDRMVGWWMMGEG